MRCSQATQRSEVVHTRLHGRITHYKLGALRCLRSAVLLRNGSAPFPFDTLKL